MDNILDLILSLLDSGVHLKNTYDVIKSNDENLKREIQDAEKEDNDTLKWEDFIDEDED